MKRFRQPERCRPRRHAPNSPGRHERPRRKLRRAAGKLPNVGTIVRPGEIQFFLRLHGLWEGVIDLPPSPDPPFDIETFEPIEPPWQAVREWIPDDDAEAGFDLCFLSFPKLAKRFGNGCMRRNSVSVAGG